MSTLHRVCENNWSVELFFGVRCADMTHHKLKLYPIRNYTSINKTLAGQMGKKPTISAVLSSPYKMLKHMRHSGSRCIQYTAIMGIFPLD